jgi:molybdate transport system substrate-binding protein
MFYHGVRLLVSVVLMALAACRPSTAPAPTTMSPSAELTVAAAADLQFAFTEITQAYEQQTGHRVTLTFGSTGQLAQQIENGAPFDLLAAANIQYVKDLADKQLVLPDSIALYAQGRIVLAVNRQSGVTATTLEDLLSSNIKHVAIANPAHAPYGVAAQQALQSAGLWDKLQDKQVFGENVRQTLQYIQTGDAEAGIVALSVANVPEITWTLIDGSLHQPLDQALGIVASSRHPDLARDFAAFINGQFGRPVMRQYGFIRPGETPIVQSVPKP